MNNMNTGEQKSTSYNLNVGAENKKSISVNATDVMTQSSSRSRGGRMDLDSGEVKPMKPSNKDTYQ